MSDLDELMSRDPLSLSSADIDSIITFHRAARAKRVAGEKPARTAKQGLDLTKITQKLVHDAAPPVKIDRRI